MLRSDIRVWNALASVTLTFNLPRKNVSNGTSPPQGQQLCQIVLKSMHYCTSYGSDKSGRAHARTHARTHAHTLIKNCYNCLVYPQADSTKMTNFMLTRKIKVESRLLKKCNFLDFYLIVNITTCSIHEENFRR